MTLKDIIIAGKLTISEGGGGGDKYPLALGGYYDESRYTVYVRDNHVTYTGKTNANIATPIGLREIPVVNTEEWFSIPAGSDVKISYKNIVNNGGIVWNANLKRAETSTSLSYGIGDGTHTDGDVVKEVTNAEADSVGCVFLYIATNKSDSTLEFDIEIEINGERKL